MTRKGPSRRAVTVGGGIAATLGLLAVGVTVPRLIGHHYRASRYDDLFANLIDRDEAVKLGQAALRQGTKYQFDSVLSDPIAGLARNLRSRLERRTLAEVANSDLAEGRLAEVQGWVLPQSLVLLCMLAAREG